MADTRAPRPKKPIIIALVVLGVVLGIRAWNASNEGYERGVYWFLLAGAVALIVAAWWTVRRQRRKSAASP